MRSEPDESEFEFEELPEEVDGLVDGVGGCVEELDVDVDGLCDLGGRLVVFLVSVGELLVDLEEFVTGVGAWVMSEETGVAGTSAGRVSARDMSFVASLCE